MCCSEEALNRIVRRKQLEEMDPEVPTDDSLIPGLPRDIALQCLARSPITSLWGVCKRWQEIIEKSDDLHYARVERGKSEMNWLYTLVHTRGGSYSWNAFDPLTEKWHSLPPMPEAVDFQLTTPGSIGLSHVVQCVSTKKKLVMVAGLKPTPSSGDGQNWSTLEPALQHPWVFDPKSCQWRKGRAFGTPRKWCVCGVADEKVYVASGCGQQWDMRLSKTTEEYDPESDSWSSLPDLESSKFSGEAISAVNVGGKLYMVSGRGVFMKEGVVFCPQTKTLSKMQPGLKRGWSGSCVSVNDRFYLLDEACGKLSTYNPEADCWTVVLEDPSLKDMTNMVASDGKIFGFVNIPGNADSEADGSTVRIVDLAMDPPAIHTHAVPQGRVVSMQILARMTEQILHN